ncbi:hypothetical protein Ancab_039236, partial [Ancistrocladus abbreviatus]
MESDRTPQYRSISMAACGREGGMLEKMEDMVGMAAEKSANDRGSYDDMPDLAYCGTSRAEVDKKDGQADEAQVINSLMGPETPYNDVGRLAFGPLQKDEIKGGYSHVGQMKSVKAKKKSMEDILNINTKKNIGEEGKRTRKVRMEGKELKGKGDNEEWSSTASITNSLIMNRNKVLCEEDRCNE